MQKGGYNIYFSASIAGGREDAPIYSSLVAYLEEHHGTVLDKHVADPHLTIEGDGEIPPHEIYNQDLEWLLRSDVVVAEVTTVSHGVGFELGYFVRHHRDDPTNRVLCLYRPTPGKILSAMFSGCPQALLANYKTIEEAYRHIDAFFLSLPPQLQPK